MDDKATISAPPSIRSILRTSYPDLLFLLTLDWVVHFWYFYRFGLYEDDWYFNAGPYNWSATVWFDLMWQQVAELTFGRPIEILLLYINSYIGYALGSVPVLYLLAYLYSAAMTVLVYLLLRHCFPRRLALLAATLFVLSPLTTVRQFLNTAFKMAPSYIFAMAGMLAYLRGRRWLAYPLGALTLITYEWLFLVFLGAPLLERSAPLLSRKTLRHAVICILILAAVVGGRSLIGESRVMNELPAPLELAAAAVRATTLHILNVPLLFANGAWLALMEGTAKAALFGLLLAAWYYWLAAARRRDPARSASPAGQLGAPRAVLAGAVFALLGLGLSFVVASNTTLATLKSTGRATRIFGPAEFGVALALAGAATLLWHKAASRVARAVLTLAGVALFVTLTVYQFVIQQDYIRSWHEHQSLLHDMLEQSPDIQPDSNMIVRLHNDKPRLFETRGRSETGGRYLSIGEEKAMFHWSIYFLFKPYRPVPRFYLLYRDDWPDDLELRPDGNLYWTRKPIAGFFSYQNDPLPPGRFIIYRESTPGALARDTEPIYINGVNLTQPRLAVDKSGWLDFQRTALFRFVLP